MTDFSFESPSDDIDPHSELEDRFACTRRIVDLTHPENSADGAEGSVLEDLPAHPEIVELIESLLAANPDLQPSCDQQTSERAHTVYVPEHYEAGYAYPLIVWFHRDGASESELDRVMPVISDRNYIGVALRGDVEASTGHGWSPDAGTSPELLQDVRAIVTGLRRQYHIHSERIYLAGFGSGATTAVQLMLAKPEWFGGVISFSGDLPKENGALLPVEELKDKRILLATSLGSKTSRVGDVVAAGRLLYSAGMQVGTRIYQDSENSPTVKMLRDVDSWLMDEICGSVKV